MALPALVSAEWLKSEIDKPDIVLLDASWYLPAQGRDGDAEYAVQRIPGARRFDFNGPFADPDTHLPHMLADAARFTAAARALGLNGDSRIVCYDGAGIFAAPRAWWMLRAMGHDRVAVLNGGLPAWIAAGGAVETGPAPPPAPGDFTARPVPGLIRDAEAVQCLLETGEATVVDARSVARFTGAEQETRPGLRHGHMPGAVNLPFNDLLQNGRFRPAAEIRASFAAIASPAKPLVASCGSGVTAAILALGAEWAGIGPVAVYDGAWAEWAQETRPDLPVVAEPVTGGGAG